MAEYGGRRRSSGLKTKTLRRMLKKKGLKTTGKKVTLMKRLHMRGGADSVTYRKIDGKWFAVDDKGGKVDVDAVGTDEMPADGVAYVEPSGAAPSAEAAEAEPAEAAEPADEGGKRRRRRRHRTRKEGGKRRGRSSRRGAKEMLGF
jgi:hypothetical protein